MRVWLPWVRQVTAAFQAQLRGEGASVMHAGHAVCQMQWLVLWPSTSLILCMLFGNWKAQLGLSGALGVLSGHMLRCAYMHSRAMVLGLAVWCCCGVSLSPLLRGWWEGL